MAIDLPDPRFTSGDWKDWAEKLVEAIRSQTDPALENRILEAGMIILSFDQDYDPKAFLPCDGTTYDSASFPDLAKKLVVTPGDLTFDVPDLSAITVAALILVKT